MLNFIVLIAAYRLQSTLELYIFLGMVSVCGGCDAYYPWAALFLGGIAGALHLLASIILVKMKIDDPLDAAPIHFVCGKIMYISKL